MEQRKDFPPAVRESPDGPSKLPMNFLATALHPVLMCAARAVSGADDRFGQKRFTSIGERGIIILTPNSVERQTVLVQTTQLEGKKEGKGGKGSGKEVGQKLSIVRLNSE